METKTEVEIIPENASLLKAEQKRQRADRFYDGRFCFFSEGYDRMDGGFTRTCDL